MVRPGIGLTDPVTAADLVRDLPDPLTLRDRCRAVAMLDAILCPDPLNRYFTFGPAWIPERPGTSVSMRNGSGDEYDIVFDDAGVFIRGLAHESPMAGAEPWPRLTESAPHVFAEYVYDSVFSYEEDLQATVVIWRQTGDEHWSCGDIQFPEGHQDPDGVAYLFSVIVDGTGSAYKLHAEDQHDINVDLGAVRDLFAHAPLTAAIIRQLNPSLSLADLAEDVAVVGYPVADQRRAGQAEPRPEHREPDADSGPISGTDAGSR
jgi:hypothetical protein